MNCFLCGISFLYHVRNRYSNWLVLEIYRALLTGQRGQGIKRLLGLSVEAPLFVLCPSVSGPGLQALGLAGKLSSQDVIADLSLPQAGPLPTSPQTPDTFCSLGVPE